MDLQAQYATAILMTASGALLGSIYDIYRTSLREWRFLRPFSAWFDFGFWVFALVLVFTGLLGANDGDVRLVVFVLLAMGWFIYYKTAHALVVASTRLVVRLIYQALLFAAAVFSWLVIRPAVSSCRAARSTVRAVDRALARIEPIVVWPVEQVGTLGWRYGRGVYGWIRRYLDKFVAWGKKEPIGRASNNVIKRMRHWLGRANATGHPPSEDDEDET